jgi:signal transduction histidine kinase
LATADEAIMAFWRRLVPSSEQDSYRRRVDDFRDALALVPSLDALKSEVCRRLRILGNFSAVHFCEYQPVGGAFTPTHVDGDSDGGLRPIPANGALATWMSVNQEILTIPHESGAHEFLEEDTRSDLAQHDVQICVPVVAVNSLRAVLLIATKSPSVLSPADKNLLMACGRDTGAAYLGLVNRQEELARVRASYQAQQLAIAGQLAAAVAHEVRNPLTAIRSTMQFVLTSPRQWEEKRSLIQDVIAEVDRIEETIAGALSLHRTSDATAELVDLVAIAESALALVIPYASKSSIEFRREFTCAPLRVTGNEKELRRVIVNLLFNSCQAMQDGGTVTITSSLLAADSSTEASLPIAVLQVADNGLGMSEDHLRKVFDPFFTTKKNGTGLGLAICQEVIARHDGEINIASEIGIGTVVTIRMPVRIR